MVIQHLFSSFPDSWAGTAILLLRLCVSAVLVLQGVRSGIHTHAALSTLTAAAWVTAALILVVLWTPIAAGVAAVTEVTEAPLLLTHMLVAAIAIAICLCRPWKTSVARHTGAHVGLRIRSSHHQRSVASQTVPVRGGRE